jgi:hypothetical protein
MSPVRKRKSQPRGQLPAKPRLNVELLEARCLLDAGFRSITGYGNNPDHSTWGAAGTDLTRVEPVVHYADGISAAALPDNPSARVASNNLNNQSSNIFSGADDLGPPQSLSLSDFAYVWGQFIDHDMDLTPTQSGANAETLDIRADTRLFTITLPDGTKKQIPDPMGAEPFTRSVFDPRTGTSPSNPRQQINANTSYLDLSQVYGSTQVVADALRVVEGFEPDGTPILGAHLKTSPGDLLPFDNLNYFTQDQINALNMANDAHQVSESQLFAAGDVRANENIELTAIQTLFVRNHNRLVDQLSAMNPAEFGFSVWTDNNLYQEARKLNIAEEEIITYNGYLPALLGANALQAYTGYIDDVNASIATEFSTVGFRFGHSLLSNGVGRVNNDGTAVNDPFNTNGSTVNLLEDFFRPDLINANGVKVNLIDNHGNPDPHISTGIGAILKADASNTANEFDLLLIDEIRNGLFSINGISVGPGTDLAARDVQRARDHGIGGYNDVRAAYGLPRLTSFAQITSDVQVQQELRATYGVLPNGQDNVNAVDPFEGMLAEDHINRTDFGPTMTAILVKQFAALRDGDRFFYLNESFTPAEQALIAQGNTLAKVIENNTGITNLQSNIFFFKESITGTVAVNGVGLAGVVIDLKDSSGKIIAHVTTDANGHYSFTDQTGIPGTGNFTVSVEPRSGYHVVSGTPSSYGLHISRGGLDFDDIDFQLAPN